MTNVLIIFRQKHSSPKAGLKFLRLNASLKKDCQVATSVCSQSGINFEAVFKMGFDKK